MSTKDNGSFEDMVLGNLEENLPQLRQIVITGIGDDGEVVVLGFDRDDDEGLMDENDVFRVLGMGVVGLSDLIDQETPDDE